MGDCKFTHPETEIGPGKIISDLEHLILWLRCTRLPTFLAKGQIIAQVILAPEPTDSVMKSSGPNVNAVRVIRKKKPEEVCKLTVGGETKSIKGLLDTGAHVTIIPERMWPSHWPLQTIVEHVQSVGGLQLARQSKSMVQTEGPKGQLANLHTSVLEYEALLWGRDLMAQCGVTTDLPDPPRNFQAATTEKRPTQKLNWHTR